MAPPRRRSLGLLFIALATLFAGVAAYAGTAGQWIVVAAGGALAAWMGDLAVRSLR
ncbi:MAG: hypothetical protein U0R69_10330 [Gaiellales bacterium]